MSFQKNLLQKIELDGLAAKVVASIGARQAPRSIDKESMRRLLELSPYRHQHERDLDLYVKEAEGGLDDILVLDNELPIFRSTVEDVVIRRSPRTLEMWRIRTIRRILVDSDIRMSTGEKSVEAVRKDAVALLDLTYTDKDIADLAREGMAWLAGREADRVGEILSMFAALLGYRRPPGYLGLAHMACYGVSAPGPGKDTLFGPFVLYRSVDNTLLWVERTFSRSNREQLQFLQDLATGQKTVPISGDAVFEKLQADVLKKPERVLAV